MTLVEHWPNGNIKSVESRNEDGKRHNSSGPAYQWWYKDGQAYVREYWVDGKVHNLGGPAYQTWHENGQERSRCYWVEGNPLTEDAFKALQNSVEVTCGDKTVIKHWPNGNIKSVVVAKETGRYHNPSGPALQSWHENGQEECRAYYVDGKSHNLNGPARQEWYGNGREKFREYWVDGEELTEAEFKALQNSVEVICGDKAVRIPKAKAIELGLIDKPKTTRRAK